MLDIVRVGVGVGIGGGAVLLIFIFICTVWRVQKKVCCNLLEKSNYVYITNVPVSFN